MKTTCFTLSTLLAIFMVVPAWADDEPTASKSTTSELSPLQVPFDIDENGSLSDEEQEKYTAYIAALIKPFDKNGDGKLSKSEKQAFSKFQKLASGGSKRNKGQRGYQASAKAYRNRISAAPQGRSESEKDRKARYKAYQQRFTRVLDTDRNGALTDEEKSAYENYQQLVTARVSVEPERNMRKAMELLNNYYENVAKVVDADRDGEVDEKEHAAYKEYEKLVRARVSVEPQRNMRAAMKTLDDYYETSVKLFDVDGNGEASKREMKAAKEYEKLVMARVSVEPERNIRKAKENMEAYYSIVQKLFDEDGNGEMSPEESEAYESYVKQVRDSGNSEVESPELSVPDNPC